MHQIEQRSALLDEVICFRKLRVFADGRHPTWRWFEVVPDRFVWDENREDARVAFGRGVYGDPLWALQEHFPNLTQEV